MSSIAAAHDTAGLCMTELSVECDYMSNMFQYTDKGLYSSAELVAVKGVSALPAVTDSQPS